MTIKSLESIPKEKFKQFNEILKRTGGRYLSKPSICGDDVIVSYEFGDYEAHHKAWNLCTQDIREVMKNQWWRRALRRLKMCIKYIVNKCAGG